MKNNDFLEILIIIFFAFLTSIGFFNVDASKAGVRTTKDDVVIISLQSYKNSLASSIPVKDKKSNNLISYTTNAGYVVRAYPNGEENMELPKPALKNHYSAIQLECMARNIYFESRGEGREGMAAVGYVTMNRVKSGEYPRSICGVVYQGSRNSRGELYNCQFSWVCDGTSTSVRNKKQWLLAKELAFEVANGYDTQSDPTKGSMFYHAAYLNRPFRHMKVVREVKINNHIFYRKA